MNQLPEKIGKYPIVGVAGKGNMGIVYVGYDPFADRDVAIKVNTSLYGIAILKDVDANEPPC